MSDEPASSGGQKSSASSMADMKAKFRKLHEQRQEARKRNMEQVVEEDRRAKLPQNHEAKKIRQEWQLAEIEAKEEADKRGVNYERVKALNMQADTADKIDASKRRKHNPDTGFSDYEAMSLRQHQRLTNAYKPDMETYQKMKAVIGEEEFFPTANTLVTGQHYPTAKAMDRLSQDVVGQAKKREQYHRRRMFDPEAPIDYINEKNRKFNEKLEKFYGKYTDDLREDLERGTAI